RRSARVLQVVARQGQDLRPRPPSGVDHPARPPPSSAGRPAAKCRTLVRRLLDDPAEPLSSETEAGMGRTRSFIFYLLVAAAGCGEGAHTSIGSNQSALLWHAGVFRYLPSQSADLETFVSGLSHPTSGYGKVSSTRTD